MNAGLIARLDRDVAAGERGLQLPDHGILGRP